MSNKMALLLFTTSVLLTSVIAVFVPQASALTQSTRFDTISTASFGHSVVCGDHVCVPGEHTAWIDAMWASQKVSYGKIGSAQYGEDVMTALAGSAAFHGNNTMNSNMGNNMTSSMSMPSK
ncbi:MAG: hypothetical protein ACYDAJ_11065 [Nitrosotalea sp.]